MCRKNCSKTACPFAHTDESETIQNYGCLPTPYEIIGMQLIKGKTWACHSDPTKPCLGALKRLKELDIKVNTRNFELVTEETILIEDITFTSNEKEILEVKLSLN